MAKVRSLNATASCMFCLKFALSFHLHPYFVCASSKDAISTGISCTGSYMGWDVIKPVFGVSDQVIHKPAYSATETSWNSEISLVACFDMILSNKSITKALIRLRGCAGWSAPLLFSNLEDRFSRMEAHIIDTTFDWCFHSTKLFKSCEPLWWFGFCHLRFC